MGVLDEINVITAQLGWSLLTWAELGIIDSLTLFRGRQKHLRVTFSSNYCSKAAINDYFNGL